MKLLGLIPVLEAGTGQTQLGIQVALHHVCKLVALQDHAVPEVGAPGELHAVPAGSPGTQVVDARAVSHLHQDGHATVVPINTARRIPHVRTNTDDFLVVAVADEIQMMHGLFQQHGMLHGKGMGVEITAASIPVARIVEPAEGKRSQPPFLHRLAEVLTDGKVAEVHADHQLAVCLLRKAHQFDCLCKLLDQRFFADDVHPLREASLNLAMVQFGRSGQHHKVPRARFRL